MKQMAIIDIDDVILDWTKGFSKFIGVDLTQSNKRIHEVLKISIDEEIRLITQFNQSEAFGGLPFITDAIDGINLLKNTYTLYFVTSCGNSQITMDLRINNLTTLVTPEQLIFLDLHKPKNEIIKQLQPKLMVDDNVENVLYSMYNSCNGYVFDTPWSRSKFNNTVTWKDIIYEHNNSV